MRIDGYELLEMVANDGERTTFNALDVSSSKNVILHLLNLSPESAGRSDLAQLVKMLVAGGKSDELLYAGENEGRLCVVTEAVPECYDIRRWLEERVQANPVAKPRKDPGQTTLKLPTVGTQAEPPPSTEPGEFTKRFALSPLNTLAPESPRDEPGEFTRIFRNSTQEPDAVQPWATPAPSFESRREPVLRSQALNEDAPRPQPKRVETGERAEALTAPAASQRPLILGLIGLSVVALALVLYFALTP
jgi:hypothetical protein